MARAQATVTTDHDEIRRWAEDRGATPACVRDTGGDGDIGMLRLDFPGYSGEQSLEHITWDQWFQKFDERGLALLHQEQTARGQKSNFNKIIARETAEHRARGERKYSRRHPERGRATAGARRSAGRSTAGRTGTTTSKGRSARRAATSRKAAKTRTIAKGTRGASGGRTTKKRPATKSAATRRRSTASVSRSSSRGRIGGGARVLTDHDEIRRWAEERKAAPACVRGTGGGKDVGMIRLDFPGFSGARSLEHVDWDEWFKAFDDSKLALIVQDTTARGQRSNFNKLVGRETAEARRRGVSGGSRRHPERAARSKTHGRAANKSTAKSTRGSTRAKRTESARGRETSRRKAA